MLTCLSLISSFRLVSLQPEAYSLYLHFSVSSVTAFLFPLELEAYSRKPVFYFLFSLQPETLSRFSVSLPFSAQDFTRCNLAYGTGECGSRPGTTQNGPRLSLALR